jgi:hypothetical protein
MPVATKALASLFHDRVEEGNLFDRQHLVVPIKTRGRTYGTISQQFVKAFPHIPTPSLEFRHAQFVVIDEGKHLTATFVAYWDDEMRYTPDHAAICAGRAMMRFSLDSLKLVSEWNEPDPWTLSMPLFKGAEKSVDHIASMEDELQETYQALVTRGIIPCEVEVVVLDADRVPAYS